MKLLGLLVVYDGIDAWVVKTPFSYIVYTELRGRDSTYEPTSAGRSIAIARARYLDTRATARLKR